MAILAPIDIPAMELYVRRFCVRVNSSKMAYTTLKYAPLVSFAELDWIQGSKSRLFLGAECEPIEQLTSSHFNLVQLNAEGWSHLFLWFPPMELPVPDEYRLMKRAGVRFFS